MEAPRGRTGAAVIERLLAEPYNFDFFQAVRLLERSARDLSRDGPVDAGDGASFGSSGASQGAPVASQPVGRDAPPDAEAVRFRAVSSLAYPGSTIAEALAPSLANARSGYELSVHFMGLTGAAGALPHHYTSMVIERLRERDPGLKEFFDLFNHRLISLFFRSWEKYRFPTAYERTYSGDDEPVAYRSGPAVDDAVTACVYAIVGLGMPSLRQRVSLEDETFLRYAGLMSSTRHSAVALERMVADHFNVPARVMQFQGQWLYIEPADRSRLSGRPLVSANCVLGSTVVLGNRVWDVQSKFRVRLGPIGYAQYCRLLPDGSDFARAMDLIRTFVGAEFDFEIQPVLRAEEIPTCRLGSTFPAPQRLGRNLWLKSKVALKDFEDAAFKAG